MPIVSTDPTNRRAEVDAIADLASQAKEVETIEFESVPGAPKFEIAVVPQGVKLESIKKFADEYRQYPERRKGTAELATLESFIAHAKRFADEGSALFANPKMPHPTLTSVLDYHPEGGADAVKPRWGDHRGVYRFPISDEWRAWTDRDGSEHAMIQGDFAAFLEDHLLDIADPSTAGESSRAFAANMSMTFATPAKLLELSRGLTIRVGSRLKSQSNRQTGEAVLQFETQHTDDAGAPLNVPGAFLLTIPVFRGGDVYQIPARLRYRAREHNVLWHFELFRPERMFDDAFRNACDKASVDTNLPLFVGSSEP